MASVIEKQVKDLLEQIHQVDGVQHVFVCDGQGMVLGTRSKSQLVPLAMDRAAIHVKKIWAAIQKRDGKPTEIETQYEHDSLLTRELGQAFVVVVYTRNINLPVLRVTLNVAATRFTQDANLQKALAQIIPFSDALQIMDVFINELIDEFGDRGIGRSNLVEQLAPSVEKLKLQYPFFREIAITNRGIDFSSLTHVVAAPREIITAWGDLVMAICTTAIAGLGESAVVKKYRQVGIKIYRQNKKIFQDMDLVDVIPELEIPIGF